MSTYHTHSVNLSREFAMARFAEPYPASVPHDSGRSSQRMMGNSASSLDGSRMLAGMLLAAGLAALLVVADLVISAWSDGHLLAGWVALWTLAFAALAVLAPSLRQLSAFLAGGFLRKMASLHAEREEARMWDLASHDPRVMEEIRAAMSRHAE
jgi:hypothetical protein